MSSRPLVVLAGWLGSQPKHLKPYEQLYQRLGFQTIQVIASPPALIQHSQSRRAVTQIKIPKSGWPSSSSLSDDVSTHKSIDRDASVQDVAWHVLAEIEKQQSCGWIFHGFSNGGAFIWEQIRVIMNHYKKLQQQQPEQSELSSLSSSDGTRQRLEHLESQILGVAFDSAPCWFGFKPSPFRSLLNYCSWQDKLKLMVRVGPSVFSDEPPEELIWRSHQYFDHIQNDTLDVPQLFINSKDDPLASYRHIEKLVQERKQRQSKPVFQKTWEKSTHCAHLKSFPKEYQEEVEVFSAACLLRSKL